MADYIFRQSKRGISKNTADAGLVASGSIAFASGDDLVTEKKTSSISLPTGKKEISPEALFLLVIDKPAENTAGNLTIKTYNEVKVDDTNQRDVLLTTHTVEKITSLGTFRSFLIQGLFFGEGGIKLSATFATESGAITVYYKLYRL